MKKSFTVLENLNSSTYVPLNFIKVTDFFDNQLKSLKKGKVVSHLD